MTGFAYWLHILVAYISADRRTENGYFCPRCPDVSVYVGGGIRHLGGWEAGILLISLFKPEYVMLETWWWVDWI